MDTLIERLQAALADRYRIERELGRGGMGLVFLAKDLKHGRRVALKVLRPEVAQSLGADRFLREIRISAQLSHPNILTLIDSGTAGGFTYYVLPYVEGESLRERINREGQLPLAEALRITREAADALAHAHSLGIVHRDIKPENILFEAGHAVVADFGIARAVSEAGGEQLTETGMAVGTPAYMSPEQSTASGPVDARSDVYSLACVLYEMLAGAPPYAAATPQGVLARKAVEPAPGLRVVRDTVPAGVEAVIMRALARVPADRYATAYEFAAALLEGETTTQLPAAGARFFRGRWIAVAQVIVVIAAAAYIALALAGRGDRGPALTAATSTRLTADPGVEWFPSLSPDGTWLLYTGDASGNRDVFLLSVGAQNAINLTADSPADDDQAVFSPDGRRIAFRSDRDGGGIFVMGRTGEAVRRVAAFGYRPTWSPDGNALAFVTENVDLNPQNIGTESQLWIVDLRTGELRQIEGVDATLPSWSPNGHRIAFYHRLGGTAQGDLWTVAVADGRQTPVTEGAWREWSPAWSRDGAYLYFVSDRGGSMNLWRVRIDERTGQPRADPEPITTPATSLAHPSVAGDGRHIAYSSVVVTSNVQRVAFDPERGVVRGDAEWVTQGSRRWSDPEPSPDGRSVVLYSLVEPEGQLYLAPVDEVARPRRVTTDSASHGLPRWSPDGEWIAFFSNLSGPYEIWKIRGDGSSLSQLTNRGSSTAYPVWSPDGSRMVAAGIGTPGGTLLFDPNRRWEDQQPEMLPDPPDSLAPFAPHAWSADGRRLAGMIGGFDQGVVTYTFATRTYERLTDFGQWPIWLPDGRHLLFVSSGNALYVVDRETRAVRRVLAVNRDVIGPPQLTRDGRMLYYTRRVTEADIWLVTLR